MTFAVMRKEERMSDLISRQAAIDGLDGHYIERRNLNDWQAGWNAALDWIGSTYLDEFPSAQFDKDIDVPSNDTISRQAAVDAIKKRADKARDMVGSDHPFWEGLIVALDIVEQLPSAQPERKTGKWNFIGDNMFECTSCGVVYTTNQLNGLRNYDTDPYAPKFCPNCGADMRGKE